ncbi:MAG TPA: hypothetical protein PLJ71_16570 [Candidatus Hydrogenedentes bacterium]|nr:hypothetical protein [Candidatus Hydrogenedentota bacterium]HQM50303.1 hypothetical protein [Candidatus Hydrogenedentota bacterium]
MLTGKERFARILRRQKVDRIGLFEVFWRETAQKWSQQGHFGAPETVGDHFGLDMASHRRRHDPSGLETA